MFIKLNFNTVQSPSIWFDAVYWIMINQSKWTSINTGAQNASIFYNTVTDNTQNPAVTAGNFQVGSSYTILSTGTGTTWTSIGASASTPGTTFVATGVGTGTGTAYLTASSALKTAVSTLDYTNSEIWNSTFSGSMPVVNYNSAGPSLTIKHAIQDDATNTTYSWLQINATTFQQSTSAGSALTANTTGTSAITLNNASVAQTWSKAESSFCYWAYISPTVFTWASTRAYNNTTSTNQYTKSGWHMNNNSSDWTYTNSRQSGPFMSTQYTRLDVWNTVSNGIVPVSWINGYDATYRPLLGMSYSYDIAYGPNVVGNLINSYNYNPRFSTSNSNTTFSIMNTIDATPNNTGTWNIYGAPATGSLAQSTATAGQKVSFGTNIKPFQDQSSLVNGTYNQNSGTSGYVFQGSNSATSYTASASSNPSIIQLTVAPGTVTGAIITGPGITNYPPTYITYVSSLLIYLSQPLTTAFSSTIGAYAIYPLTNYQYASVFKTNITGASPESTVIGGRSIWHGIQGASLWDSAQQNQNGNFYRWPTATATATGAFTMQPLVWNRPDFNNIGGLISDKAGIYLFNGDYTAGDEFTVGGITYSIWPMADGWNQRIGLAVPKR
jgi:hypothetical protein